MLVPKIVKEIRSVHYSKSHLETSIKLYHGFPFMTFFPQAKQGKIKGKMPPLPTFPPFASDSPSENPHLPFVPYCQAGGGKKGSPLGAQSSGGPRPGQKEGKKSGPCAMRIVSKVRKSPIIPLWGDIPTVGGEEIMHAHSASLKGWTGGTHIISVGDKALSPTEISPLGGSPTEHAHSAYYAHPLKGSARTGGGKQEGVHSKRLLLLKFLKENALKKKTTMGINKTFFSFFKTRTGSKSLMVTSLKPKKAYKAIPGRGPTVGGYLDILEGGPPKGDSRGLSYRRHAGPVVSKVRKSPIIPLWGDIPTVGGEEIMHAHSASLKGWTGPVGTGRFHAHSARTGGGPLLKESVPSFIKSLSTLTAKLLKRSQMIHPSSFSGEKGSPLKTRMLKSELYAPMARRKKESRISRLILQPRMSSNIHKNSTFMSPFCHSKAMPPLGGYKSYAFRTKGTKGTKRGTFWVYNKRRKQKEPIPSPVKGAGLPLPVKIGGKGKAAIGTSGGTLKGSGNYIKYGFCFYPFLTAVISFKLLAFVHKFQNTSFPPKGLQGISALLPLGEAETVPTFLAEPSISMPFKRNLGRYDLGTSWWGRPKGFPTGGTKEPSPPVPFLKGYLTNAKYKTAKKATLLPPFALASPPGTYRTGEMPFVDRYAKKLMPVWGHGSSKATVGISWGTQNLWAFPTKKAQVGDFLTLDTTGPGQKKSFQTGEKQGPEVGRPPLRGIVGGPPREVKGNPINHYGQASFYIENQLKRKTLQSGFRFYETLKKLPLISTVFKSAYTPPLNTVKKDLFSIKSSPTYNYLFLPMGEKGKKRRLWLTYFRSHFVVSPPTWALGPLGLLKYITHQRAHKAQRLPHRGHDIPTVGVPGGEAYTLHLRKEIPHQKGPTAFPTKEGSHLVAVPSSLKGGYHTHFGGDPLGERNKGERNKNISFTKTPLTVENLILFKYLCLNCQKRGGPPFPQGGRTLPCYALYTLEGAPMVKEGMDFYVTQIKPLLRTSHPLLTWLVSHNTYYGTNSPFVVNPETTRGAPFVTKGLPFGGEGPPYGGEGTKKAQHKSVAFIPPLGGPKGSKVYNPPTVGISRYTHRRWGGGAFVGGREKSPGGPRPGRGRETEYGFKKLYAKTYHSDNYVGIFKKRFLGGPRKALSYENPRLSKEEKSPVRQYALPFRFPLRGISPTFGGGDKGPGGPRPGSLDKIAGGWREKENKGFFLPLDKLFLITLKRLQNFLWSIKVSEFLWFVSLEKSFPSKRVAFSRNTIFFVPKVPPTGSEEIPASDKKVGKIPGRGPLRGAERKGVSINKKVERKALSFSLLVNHKKFILFYGKAIYGLDTFQKRKREQKEFRAKKQNLERRRQQKRKRFYARPTWLRVRLYENKLIKKMSFLEPVIKGDSKAIRRGHPTLVGSPQASLKRADVQNRQSRSGSMRTPKGVGPFWCLPHQRPKGSKVYGGGTPTVGISWGTQSLWAFGGEGTKKAQVGVSPSPSVGEIKDRSGSMRKAHAPDRSIPLGSPGGPRYAYRNRVKGSNKLMNSLSTLDSKQKSFWVWFYNTFQTFNFLSFFEQKDLSMLRVFWSLNKTHICGLASFENKEVDPNQTWLLNKNLHAHLKYISPFLKSFQTGMKNSFAMQETTSQKSGETQTGGGKATYLLRYFRNNVKYKKKSGPVGTGRFPAHSARTGGIISIGDNALSPMEIMHALSWSSKKSAYYRTGEQIKQKQNKSVLKGLISKVPKLNISYSLNKSLYSLYRKSLLNYHPFCYILQKPYTAQPEFLMRGAPFTFCCTPRNFLSPPKVGIIGGEGFRGITKVRSLRSPLGEAHSIISIGDNASLKGSASPKGERKDRSFISPTEGGGDTPKGEISSGDNAPDRWDPDRGRKEGVPVGGAKSGGTQTGAKGRNRQLYTLHLRKEIPGRALKGSLMGFPHQIKREQVENAGGTPNGTSVELLEEQNKDNNAVSVTTPLNSQYARSRVWMTQKIRNQSKNNRTKFIIQAVLTKFNNLANVSVLHPGGGAKGHPFFSPLLSPNGGPPSKDTLLKSGLPIDGDKRENLLNNLLDTLEEKQRQKEEKINYLALFSPPIKANSFKSKVSKLYKRNKVYNRPVLALPFRGSASLKGSIISPTEGGGDTPKGEISYGDKGPVRQYARSASLKGSIISYGDKGPGGPRPGVRYFRCKKKLKTKNVQNTINFWWSKISKSGGTQTGKKIQAYPPTIPQRGDIPTYGGEGDIKYIIATQLYTLETGLKAPLRGVKTFPMPVYGVATLFFHFLSFIGLISLSQIRCILKFNLILIYKLSNAYAHIVSNLYVVFNVCSYKLASIFKTRSGSPRSGALSPPPKVGEIPLRGKSPTEIKDRSFIRYFRSVALYNGGSKKRFNKSNWAVYTGKPLKKSYLLKDTKNLFTRSSGGAPSKVSKYPPTVGRGEEELDTLEAVENKTFNKLSFFGANLLRHSYVKNKLIFNEAYKKTFFGGYPPLGGTFFLPRSGALSPPPKVGEIPLRGKSPMEIKDRSLRSPLGEALPLREALSPEEMILPDFCDLYTLFPPFVRDSPDRGRNAEIGGNESTGGATAMQLKRREKSSKESQTPFKTRKFLLLLKLNSNFILSLFLRHKAKKSGYVLNTVTNKAIDFYFQLTKRNTVLFFQSVLKIIDLLEGGFRAICMFFEKPAQQALDWIAYSFLVEWGSDMTSIIPENVDLAVWKWFVKNSRSLKITVFAGSLLQRRLFCLFYMVVEKLNQPDCDLITRKRKGILFWDIWADLLMKEAEARNINISSLASIKEERTALIDQLLYGETEKNVRFAPYPNGGGPEASLPSLSVPPKGPPSDVYKSGGTQTGSQKSGGGAYQQSLGGPRPGPRGTRPVRSIISRGDDTNISYGDKGPVHPLREAHFLEDQESASLKGSIISYGDKGPVRQYARSASLKGSIISYGDKGPGQKGGNKVLPDRQVATITSMALGGGRKANIAKHHYKWGASQQSSFKQKHTDLFVDLNLCKSFSHVSAIKYYSQLQQPLGSLVCQIYAGLFYKQIAKNVLVIGSSAMEKSLLIEAMAGETEIKIMTDNAHRYALVNRGLAVGIKLLKDVFDAICLQTPCLFLLEDIHAIGERRPLSISDSSNNENTKSTVSNQRAFVNSEALEVHEKNQVLIEFSKHALTHYKKPYKGEFSQSIVTNRFCFDLFLGHSAPRTRHLGTSLPSAIHLKTDLVGKYNKTFASCLQLPSEVSKFRKNSTSAAGNQVLSPPSTSPFTVLLLKQQKKLKPKKLLKEIALAGLPGEQLTLLPKLNYSVRVKVALLADLALSNMSAKLDMITDLLVIIDNVRSNRGFVIFATTHSAYSLDPALRRPGRLDETIRVPFISNLCTRWEILKSNMSFFFTQTNPTLFSNIPLFLRGGHLLFLLSPKGDTFLIPPFYPCFGGAPYGGAPFCELDTLEVSWFTTKVLAAKAVRRPSPTSKALPDRGKRKEKESGPLSPMEMPRRGNLKGSAYYALCARTGPLSPEEISPLGVSPLPSVGEIMLPLREALPLKGSARTGGDQIGAENKNISLDLIEYVNSRLEDTMPFLSRDTNFYFKNTKSGGTQTGHNNNNMNKARGATGSLQNLLLNFTSTYKRPSSLLPFSFNNALALCPKVLPDRVLIYFRGGPERGKKERIFAPVRKYAHFLEDQESASLKGSIISYGDKGPVWEDLRAKSGGIISYGDNALSPIEIMQALPFRGPPCAYYRTGKKSKNYQYIQKITHKVKVVTYFQIGKKLVRTLSLLAKVLPDQRGAPSKVYNFCSKSVAFIPPSPPEVSPPRISWGTQRGRVGGHSFAMTKGGNNAKALEAFRNATIDPFSGDAIYWHWDSLKSPSQAGPKKQVSQKANQHNVTALGLDALQQLQYVTLYENQKVLKHKLMDLLAGKIAESFIFSERTAIYPPLGDSRGFTKTAKKVRSGSIISSGDNALSPMEIKDRSGSIISSGDNASLKGSASRKDRGDPDRVLIYFRGGPDRATKVLSYRGKKQSFSSAYGVDQSWRAASSLVISFMQKRYIYNKNMVVTSLLHFANGALFGEFRDEPPNPPDSNVLLLAKRYENYKRSLAMQEKKLRIGLNSSIEKHEQQRFLKKLYNLPVKQSFRSEKIEASFTGFTNAALQLNTVQDSANKLTGIRWFYKNRILKRHQYYLTNQWYNGQLPEHNTETVFLSDVDWRYTFVESIGDLLIDFPDADQIYNPRQRKWLLNPVRSFISSLGERILPHAHSAYYARSASLKGSMRSPKGVPLAHTTGPDNATSTYFSNFLSTQNISSQEIYEHFLMEAFTAVYKHLNQNREALDTLAYKYMKMGYIKEVNLINLINSIEIN